MDAALEVDPAYASPTNEFHELAESEDLTLEALQPALDALAPGDVEQKLGAKDDVRPAASARHAR